MRDSILDACYLLANVQYKDVEKGVQLYLFMISSQYLHCTRAISLFFLFQSHENISEKANSPDESPGRKHSTADRKQSTAERKLSKAERKRSTAENKHARSKSLESTESNPEVQYLMYEMQGLQAEVNALKGQLEEETKRSQELKSLKTQQVCALTFKLAGAIRQREVAEENAKKARAELEEFQSQVKGCTGCSRVMTLSEKQEVIDKLRKISEESDSSVRVDDETKEEEEKQEEGPHAAVSEESEGGRRNSRKSGVVITPDDLEKLIEGRQECLNESGYQSFWDDTNEDKTVCDVETQTAGSPEGSQRTLIDQETQCDAADEGNPRQMNHDVLSREFRRIQQELGEVRGNMSMVQALNQRLSEDLQALTGGCFLDGAEFPQVERGVVKAEEVSLDSAVGTVPTEQFKREQSVRDDNDLVQIDTESPQRAAAEQMQLLKEQLQVAMMEISQLRCDNNEMKKDVRKISENAEKEVLERSTRFTAQLLKDMKHREASMRSRRSSCSSDTSRYSFALVDNSDRDSADRVFLTEKVTRTQCPQQNAQPESTRSVRSQELYSKSSLPVRRLGNRLQEMTDTLDDMTEQELLYRCASQELPSPVPFGHRKSPSSAPKHRYQRRGVAETLAPQPVLEAKEEALYTPAKLGEHGIRSASGPLLVGKEKGLLDGERSKPLDFSRAERNSYSLRDSRQPFSAPNANDHIQRHIVRCSDYIAKMRDLRPEELD